MKGCETMERSEGLYIYKLEYLYEDNKIICVPIWFHEGYAIVLSADENGFWTPDGIPIDDFATIGIDSLYKKLCDIGPLPPNDKSSFKCELIQMELDYGQYYNSIYRPLFTNNFRDGLFVPYNESVPSLNFYRDLPLINYIEYSNRLRQLEIVLDDLYAVFNVVAPEKKQGSVYGHALRNIIILACTEIDSMMHVILDRNKVTPIGKHFQMIDYYQLKEALRLDEYKLGFYRFPNLETFSPFAEWKGNKNPFWYDAYNLVKHERETKFNKASLCHALNSVMAFAIVLIAQFGYRNDLWNEKIGKIIRVDREPVWDLTDFYLQKFDNNVVVSYPFPKELVQEHPEKKLAEEILSLSNNIKKNRETMLYKIDELKKLINK